MKNNVFHTIFKILNISFRTKDAHLKLLPENENNSENIVNSELESTVRCKLYLSLYHVTPQHKQTASARRTCETLLLN